MLPAMKRLLPFLFCIALASCSTTSDSEKKPTAGGGFLCPVQAGGVALGGAMTVVSVTPNPGAGVIDVVVRAAEKPVSAFVRPRWFADASQKREYRANGDGWSAVKLEAGKAATIRVVAPYPFATTLGLEFAAARPKAVTDEGKALPGRIVVTPEQEKALVLYRYPDLELTQYESAKHAGAPKLAVWRDPRGKVVAALEIHVRKDAKKAEGLSFLHTNGRKTIGTSLVHAEAKKCSPSEDRWDFVIFRGADGSEIAVPWKPLVKNASFAGVCGIGAAGLDVAQLGSEAQIGSIAADGTADLETVNVEPPNWSMANPTGGSMSSGAPVQCEYSGTQAQRWEIRITDDMSFTPSSGSAGGKYACGTLPAGTGATQLGTLHALRAGQHQFLYETETLQSDPASDDRLTTSDGPVCPGDAASEATEILSDAANPCASEVPGCATRPVGSFVELVVPCTAAGGTAIHAVTQKDEEPGFVAVACDGQTRERDTAFDATPVDEFETTQTWIAIDNGVFMCPPPDDQEDIALAAGEAGCNCQTCQLIVVKGEAIQTGLPAGGSMEPLERGLDRFQEQEFSGAGGEARRNALIGNPFGNGRLYSEDSPIGRGGFMRVDPAIQAARNYGRAMAQANAGGRFHVLFYGSLNRQGSGGATVVRSVGGQLREEEGFRNSRTPGPMNLETHFANCHKWHEILFIYHGGSGAFEAVAAQFARMIKTPVRKIVFWSCWGADRISVTSREFNALKDHLMSSRCNCPGRRPPVPVPPAAHVHSTCTVCPLEPDHCPYEGTTIITAGTLTVDARVRDSDPPGSRDRTITVPLGIDFRPDPAHPGAGHWVFTSPNRRVRVITISPEGVVTESEQEGGTVFGGAPLESEPRLALRSIQRNADSVTDRLNRAQKDALAERLERVYGGGH
ncbi:MAG: hypothetical protein FD180_2982 [Planctomycetota bacterium]|nr:MAG: hypothetical protein FD180_2982 [Planctomycetota bacterium]